MSTQTYPCNLWLLEVTYVQSLTWPQIMLVNCSSVGHLVLERYARLLYSYLRLQYSFSDSCFLTTYSFSLTLLIHVQYMYLIQNSILNTMYHILPNKCTVRLRKLILDHFLHVKIHSNKLTPVCNKLSVLALTKHCGAINAEYLNKISSHLI